MLSHVPQTWPVCRLHTAQGDSAIVSLHGAQVLSWLPADGRERFYLNPKIDWHAVAQGYHSIRGGIPVCWPQFNRLGPLPKHGFARLVPWSIQQQTDDSITLRLRQTDIPEQLLRNEQSQTLWPHAFETTLQVKLTTSHLTLQLRIYNIDSSSLPFTAALHGYLFTEQIAHTSILGAQGLRYQDAASGSAGHTITQQGPITFTQEVDRIYTAFQPCLVYNQQRLLMRQSSSFGQTIVWNPGAKLCAQLQDLSQDAWQHFVCIEAAQINTPVWLDPGAVWQGWQSFCVS